MLKLFAGVLLGLLVLLGVTSRSQGASNEETKGPRALDFTVGEYFTPSGRNLGGGGVRRGGGIKPDIYAFTKSTATIRPRPRTSPTNGNCRRRRSKPCFNCSPRSAAFCM